MTDTARDPWNRLSRALSARRIHSAYLFSGTGPEPAETALRFARGLACSAEDGAPCGRCDACRRSELGDGDEPIPLDGTGKKGPLLRHVGDHPDLLWVERGRDDTRVRIGQIRALQHALRLQASESGWRAAVVADAEWLNQEAQNALLRTLEEPPPRTSLILVTQSPAGLLATVRSRCQRVLFPRSRDDVAPSEEEAEWLERLEGVTQASLPELLDWAEEFRGVRAQAAESLTSFLQVASAWLHRRTTEDVMAGRELDPSSRLQAFATLQQCRKGLAQRNANPQMMAERALIALHDARG